MLLALGTITVGFSAASVTQGIFDRYDPLPLWGALVVADTIGLALILFVYQTTMAHRQFMWDLYTRKFGEWDAPPESVPITQRASKAPTVKPAAWWINAKVWLAVTIAALFAWNAWVILSSVTRSPLAT